MNVILSSPFVQQNVDFIKRLKNKHFEISIIWIFLSQTEQKPLKAFCGAELYFLIVHMKDCVCGSFMLRVFTALDDI